MPGFLGGPRQVAVVLMFAVLFVVLFGALMYAVSYYRDSIERAKSDQELASRAASSALSYCRSSRRCRGSRSTLSTSHRSR